MGRVEPVEKRFMPAAPLAVVQQHQHHSSDLHPLVVGRQHLDRRKPRLAAQHHPQPHKIPQKAVYGPDCHLQYPALPQQIQQYAAQQKAPSAIRNAGPHRQWAGNKKCHDRRTRRLLRDLRHRHQKRRYHKRPQKNAQDRGCAPDISFCPQPVDPLPNDAEQRQRLEDRILRIKSVAPAQQSPVHHKELNGCHAGSNGPNAQKIALSVMGMGKALHCTKQKQRRTETPQHTEQLRHHTGKCKKVMDVVQQHQDQCDAFQRRAGKSGFG